MTRTRCSLIIASAIAYSAGIAPTVAFNIPGIDFPELPTVYTFDYISDPGAITSADVLGYGGIFGGSVVDGLNGLRFDETLRPTFRFNGEVTGTLGDPAFLGASTTLSTRGEIGVEFKARSEIGAFGGSADLRLQASVPNDVTAGTPVDLNPTIPTTVRGFSSTTGTRIYSATPDFEVSVSPFIDATLDVKTDGCLVAFCESLDLRILDYETQTDLFEFTPKEARLGIKGAFNVSIPTASAQGEIVVGVIPPFVSVELNNGVSIPGIPQALGSADIGGFAFELPTGDVTAFQRPGALFDFGKTLNGPEAVLALDYASMNVDLDSIATAQTAGLVPVLGGANFDVGVAGFSGDLWDFDATIRQGIEFAIALNPDMKVDMLFDQLVQIDGNFVNSWTGSWLQVPEISFFEDTLVTPSFFLSADLNIRSSMLFDMFIDVNLLKAEASVGPVTTTFGPAFNDEITLLDDVRIGGTEFRLSDISPIFPDLFGRSYFGVQQASPFTVRVAAATGGGGDGLGGPDNLDGGDGSPTPVPLPAGGVLLIGALAGLAALRRRPR